MTLMTDLAALTLNSDCYCWPVARGAIVRNILAQNAAPHMAALLDAREHYFASTTIFLAPKILAQMKAQIRALEDIIALPKYIEAVTKRAGLSVALPKTQGVFMGYDFHITEDGPRLIEINSNAGGAFIVDQIDKTVRGGADDFAASIYDMFQNEWRRAGRTSPLRTIAIVDTAPGKQYHYPDMCLAKTLLETQGLHDGLNVVITDPEALRINGGHLYHGDRKIDLVYNRLTDFDLSEPGNAAIARAYREDAAVVTPAPHHHALYADKRNLILLSDPAALEPFGASSSQIDTLRLIPAARAVTPDNAAAMWADRKALFFKPQAGFGSRGAFRGAKLTQKVWGQILEGGYIAQDMIAPPLRAVTVKGEKQALKFDVRVYTYDGDPLLFAARIYQGQTTNLRTAGGGLAAVIPLENGVSCRPAG